MILFFNYLAASVKGTIAATPCEHAMLVDVDLTWGGRGTGVVCFSDNYAYVDIAILLFSPPLLLTFYYYYYYNYYYLYQHYCNYGHPIHSFHSAQSPNCSVVDAY